MLSVCIPIYNQDVGELTHALHRQAEALGVEAEILLLDDASEERFRLINRQLSALPLVRYEELNKNSGRSRIRNTLALKARYPLLLYLDCDITIPRKDFLRSYLEAGRDGSVVCGGHAYQAEQPAWPYLLHWLSGSHRETKDAAIRQFQPYHSFMTASFLVPASLLFELPFNEELNGYGHEDTLYGFQLKKRNIHVKHIDNPVIHRGLEPADVFLEKTRDSLANLIKIYELTGYDVDFLDMVRVLKTCEQIKRQRLRPLLALFHSLAGHCLARRLAGRHPRLWMLDLYKLGIICKKT